MDKSLVYFYIIIFKLNEPLEWRNNLITNGVLLKVQYYEIP